MVTVPWPEFSITTVAFAQTSLRADAAAKFRWKVGGLTDLVELSFQAAPSAAGAASREMLLCSGQCVWQYGTPQTALTLLDCSLLPPLSHRVPHPFRITTYNVLPRARQYTGECRFASDILSRQTFGTSLKHACDGPLPFLASHPP